MGLVKEGDRTVVLSDILGEEDHLGDMDFKVAGTEDGITAFQMDIKIDSVDSATLSSALAQARDGRHKILEIMKQTISEPRQAISDYAPKIITMTIDPEKIGAVIGPGGKSIKSISEKSEADINIENDGTVTIYCRDKDGALEAQRLIAAIIEEPEVGKWYSGTVKRIVDFGAFIEFLPGKEGLCHISRISRERVGAVTDVLKEGQEVKVKLFEIDKIGRMNLTMVEGVETSPSSRPPGNRPGGGSHYGRPGSRDDRSGPRPPRR
jgi:polyribonucleotide nucleotidyltransferase